MILARIEIGGIIPAEIIPLLKKEIKESEVGLKYGEHLPDDFKIKSGEIITLYNDFAALGEFQELEEFLKTNNISFRRISTGNDEFPPEIRIFDKDEDLDGVYITDIDENIIITIGEIKQDLNNISFIEFLNKYNKYNKYDKYRVSPVEIQL